MERRRAWEGAEEEVQLGAKGAKKEVKMASPGCSYVNRSWNGEPKRRAGEVEAKKAGKWERERQARAGG